MATQNSINIQIQKGPDNDYTFPSTTDTLIGSKTIQSYHNFTATTDLTIDTGYVLTIADTYEILNSVTLTIADGGILRLQ